MSLVLFPKMEMHVRLLTELDLVDIGMPDRLTIEKPDNVKKFFLFKRELQLIMDELDPIVNRHQLVAIHTHQLVKRRRAVVKIPHDGLSVSLLHFANCNHATMGATYVI